MKINRERKKVISVEPKTSAKDLNAVNDVNATKDIIEAPSEAPPEEVTTTANNNPLVSFFSLLCGTICKDTPLAEYFAPPTKLRPLTTVLTELNVQGFSKDICRSMVAMLDTDRSGKLGFQEFKELWEVIRQWKNVWLMYDADKSGTFSGFELREALNSAGFRLNNKILNVLMHRYGNKSGEMEFEDFMMCSIKLKTMMELFKKKEPSGTSNANFSIDEWLENTLYS